jgi:hypothetical protein
MGTFKLVAVVETLLKPVATFKRGDMKRKIFVWFAIAEVYLLWLGGSAGAGSLSYQYDSDGRLTQAEKSADFSEYNPTAAHNFSSVLTMGDANTNGMPDSLEAYLAGYWGPDYDPFTCDSDGDGMCDWNEWMTGTDPFSADSQFAGWGSFGSSGPLEPYNYTLYWPSVPFRTYSVQFRSDLMATNWTTGATNLAATPPVNSWTHEDITNYHNFYRVQTEIAVPPPSTNTTEEGGAQ